MDIDGLKAYGHSCGGIGAGSELYYIPEKNLYYFMSINIGTATDSPLHSGIAEARLKLYQLLYN